MTAKKWTKKNMDLLKKYVDKGFAREEIVEILNDINADEGFKFSEKSIYTAISKFKLSDGRKTSKNCISWDEDLAKEVKGYVKEGKSNKQIADILSIKFDKKVSKHMVAYARSRHKIYKNGKESDELKEFGSFEDRSKELAFENYVENIKRTKKLRAFSLEKGKKYKVATDSNSEKSRSKIKRYKELEFMYETDYNLFFRDQFGIVKSFIKNNKLVKVVPA